jgi:hypothetical protein
MLHFGKIQARSKILDLAEKVRKFASDLKSRPSVAKKVFNIDHKSVFFSFADGGKNELKCLS